MHRLTPADTFVGFQEIATTTYVQGWGWDTRYPDSPLTVAVYDGERLLGAVQADQFRPDLAEGGIGNGAHGFVFPLPAPIRDHTAHRITTRVADTTITLRDRTTEGLPKPVVAPPGTRLLAALRPARSHPAPVLTPHRHYAGFQGHTSAAAVEGWAWNTRHPDTPVTVAVYDGDILLGTAVADLFREDLRDAGIGDGRHWFAFALPPALRDGKRHHITVRIADSGVTLSDPTTGEVPPPLERHDTRPFIMPFERWWYFTLLRRVLPVFSRPVWRLPATLFAFASMLRDGEDPGLDAALLTALGRRNTAPVRWRMRWRRHFLRHAHLLLTLQTDRYSPEWLMGQIRRQGTIPAGGAVLIYPHHPASFLAPLALSAFLPHFGVVASEMLDTDDPSLDPVQRTIWERMRVARRRAYSGRTFAPAEAARGTLRLLREGGYVWIAVDVVNAKDERQLLLGRGVSLPRGAAWLAQQSGKPLVPCLFVPHRAGWVLWFGPPVAPTQAGVMRGLEACVRRFPACWSSGNKEQWFNSPLWNAEPAPRAAPEVE